MGRAKEIELKVIPAKVAVPFVKAHHYSGKVVNNSSLHFGAFLDGRLHGVLSYGPSMDKRKVLGLVEGTKWDGCLELNRMAFDDYLPRNSESYCIAKSIRMIKKQAPQVKWIISFADGCQCGDGTIYRASNFVLTGIKKNKTIMEFPTGERVAGLVLTNNPNIELVRNICKKMGVPCVYRPIKEWKALGAKELEGYMLRYIYFIDPKCREKLTVPIIPFSQIDEMGAGMYKGGNVSREDRHEKKCDEQIERENKKKNKTE